MAVIASNSSTYGSLVYSVFTGNAQPVSTPAIGEHAPFIPWPSRATKFRQRVWDTVNLNWCYYEKAVIDPTPSTGETLPVNTGSITAHAVLGIDNEVEATDQ